ncbi:hypothetical protein ACET3Z_006490 [Daucus carota]
MANNSHYIPHQQEDEKRDDSAAEPNQIHDMFAFSSPNNQQAKASNLTRFAAKSPENLRYLAKQASPLHHPTLSKSSSKPSPKRSVKKSEDWAFQKSKSTSLYPSRSKKHGNEYEEAQKVSIFSSPLKSKWLFVLLGLPPKIPTDAAELKSDIRNRQSRHAPSTFFPVSVGGGCKEVVAPEESPRLKGSEKRRKSRLGSCFGSAGPVQI